MLIMRNRLANRPRAMRVRRNSINLRSRAPEYNPRLQGFCLDFFGRARLASVRNFQLVDADEPTVPNDPHAEQKCKLLFGRWSADSFHLDVKHPFSPAEACPSPSARSLTKLATVKIPPPPPLCGAATVTPVAATARWHPPWVGPCNPQRPVRH